jgi:hypothetical protein
MDEQNRIANIVRQNRVANLTRQNIANNTSQNNQTLVTEERIRQEALNRERLLGRNGANAALNGELLTRSNGANTTTNQTMPNNAMPTPMPRQNGNMNMMPPNGNNQEKKCETYPHPSIALAMAYVPFQEFDTTYTAEVGFDRGTVFPQLDQPFLGYEGVMMQEEMKNG